MKKGIDYIGIGVGCLIINDKNEVLLLKRSDKCESNAGLWTRPGGSIEFGETAEKAIKREIKEELDVELEIIKFLEYIDDLRNEKNVKRHFIALGFLGKIKGELKNLDIEENSEIMWFSLNNLPENITDYTKKSIEAYLKSVKL